MSTNEVDRALGSGHANVGQRLLAIPEDQWFERKSSRIAAKDFAIALVALANAEGGTVVVGLHDGVIEGVSQHTAKINELRRSPMEFTTPPVRVRFDQVSCDNSAGHIDTLLLARVDPGEVVHELTNGDCYLRVGDSSRKLSFAQRQELHYDRGLAKFDGEPVPGSSVGDLDEELLRGYRDNAGATGTFTRLLKARGLLTEKEEVTHAGYLLFARDPATHFPQAHVRVLRFFGTERGTGRRLSLDDDSDVRLEGPIPRVIQEAAEVIRRWQPRRRVLSDSGRFEGTPLVPEDAWLEGLVNAVIHRSYSLAGDHIRVEIFSNRIEIESPGRFPGLADPSRPLEISRYARNPRIARVCTDLRISQELGEGIKRMFDEMRERGLADPAYVQAQGSVRLVLSGLSRIDPAIEARLPRGALSVVETLRRAGQPLGTGELQELLSVSRPTLTKYLASLKDENLILWSGKSPKDPRAVWSVPEY